MIREFGGEFRWLSNFAPCTIHVGNEVFASVEHAYVSMKSVNPAWKSLCADKEMTPGMVKRLSKDIILRPGWNDTMRLHIMEDLVRIKFSTEPFREDLISTGTQNIQEGNRYNDTFFGVCLKTGIGENHLGRIIMKIRDELNTM